MDCVVAIFSLDISAGIFMHLNVLLFTALHSVSQMIKCEKNKIELNYKRCCIIEKDYMIPVGHSRVFFYTTVKPALNGPFIKRKSVLNGNIFRFLDFGAEKDVK
jgi:hypothetical protein